MPLPRYRFPIRARRSDTKIPATRIEEQLAQLFAAPPCADRFLEGVWEKIDRETACAKQARPSRISGISERAVLRPVRTIVACAVLAVGLAAAWFLLSSSSSGLKIRVTSDLPAKTPASISSRSHKTEIDLAALFPSLWDLLPVQETVSSARASRDRTPRYARRRTIARIRLVGTIHSRGRKNMTQREVALAWQNVSHLTHSVSARLQPDASWVRAMCQQQAAWLENRGRYQEASAAYACAYRLRREPGTAFAAGRTAEAAGNIEDAVAYYARLLN